MNRKLIRVVALIICIIFVITSIISIGLDAFFRR